jgi:hypothetical protein
VVPAALFREFPPACVSQYICDQHCFASFATPATLATETGARLVTRNRFQVKI